MDKLLPVLLLLGQFLVWKTEANAVTYAQGCPAADAILPCVCSTAGTSLNLDCSEVNSDEELARVFQVEFTFNQIGNFTILRLPSQERVPIFNISKDTFGEKYFENVIISHTTLNIMHDDPFEKSRNSLVTIAITDNELTSFPFSYLSLYEHLKDVRLFNNKLGRLADVTSNTLAYLQVSYNPGLEYDNEVFYNVPNLRYLGINGLGITNIAPNTFRYLSNLEYLDLSENYIQTLRNGSLWFESSSLSTVVLDYNNLSSIDPDAIKYCLPNADPNVCDNLDTAKAPAFLLTNNKLVDIPEAVWSESFTLSKGKLYHYAFDKNPIICQCNLLWLAINEDYYDQITTGTECPDGQQLNNVTDAIVGLCTPEWYYLDFE